MGFCKGSRRLCGFRSPDFVCFAVCEFEGFERFKV